MPLMIDLLKSWKGKNEHVLSSKSFPPQPASRSKYDKFAGCEYWMRGNQFSFLKFLSQFTWYKVSFPALDITTETQNCEQECARTKWGAFLVYVGSTLACWLMSSWALEWERNLNHEIWKLHSKLQSFSKRQVTNCGQLFFKCLPYLEKGRDSLLANTQAPRSTQIEEGTRL